MRYLLDTNVCIHAIKRPRGKVAMKIRSTPKADIAISAVTAAELLAGANRQKSSDQQRQACAQIVGMFSWVPFDRADAVTFGQLGAILLDQGQMIGSLDLQIAATAINQSLVVVTHNVGEFSRLPNLLMEDWQAQLGEI